MGYLDVVEEMQVRPQSQEVLDRFLALIRARDAEVRADERAKMLAGFLVERGEVWDQGAVGPVPCTRLVGPWEPVKP